MSEIRQRHSETKMVPYPSQAIVPERDIGKQPVLEARHLGIEFGGLKAVDDFNMIIGRTEIAGLIGPNGAGKTTVFNLLTKVYEPTTGTVLINGRDTKGLSIVQTAHLGVARTFQNIRLFSQMTVEENVRIGLHNQIRYDMFTGVLRLPRYWKQERRQHEETLELLSIFIARIRDRFQIAILLIEHDMSLVMGVCEGICVLNFGRIIAKGTAEEIQNNPVVIEAYLGRRKEG